MQPTEDAFRALARSSPWRWRTLHFTYADDAGEVEAWLRRPGQMLVRKPGRPDLRVDERDRADGSSTASVALVSTSREPTPLPPLRWPHEVEPQRRADGLVAARPDDVEYDDPMYQSYNWVALLDPVELSHHTTIADPRQEDRLGRRTWWARMGAAEGYEPRCGCCPLLWSLISDRDEHAAFADPEPWNAEPGTVYPDAYDVALDVETGVAVEVTPIGRSSTPSWHSVRIRDVDGDLEGLVPATPRRRLTPRPPTRWRRSR